MENASPEFLASQGALYTHELSYKDMIDRDVLELPSGLEISPDLAVIINFLESGREIFLALKKAVGFKGEGK